MYVKLFLSWFLNSTSSMNLKTVWPLLCILKQGWTEYGLTYYRVELVICLFAVCLGFFFSFFFFPPDFNTIFFSQYFWILHVCSCAWEKFICFSKSGMWWWLVYWFFQRNYRSTKRKEQIITKLWEMRNYRVCTWACSHIYWDIFSNLDW